MNQQRSQSVDEDQRYVDLDFQVAHRMLVPQHKMRLSLKNQSANNDGDQSENPIENYFAFKENIDLCSLD